MNTDIQIIPTVMPDDYEDLAEKIGFVAKAVKFVNIDVMDGVFVPSMSWPYTSSEHFDALVKQDEGLPHWEDLDFSVDLMIARPQEDAAKWIDLGVSEVIIHIESLKGDVDFIKNLKEEGRATIILALNVSTPNEELEKYNGLYDGVQFMGIAKIGYQGEPFAEEVLEKISSFKAAHPEIPIMIDGGVSTDTIKDLYEAGATRFAAGSAIFTAIDAKEAINELKSLV